MFKISATDHFEAAHQLREYRGKCRNIHGHRFAVTVVFEGEELDDKGILIDFLEVKKQLAAILADLDHIFLNEKPPFDTLNPTSENIATFIYNYMDKVIYRSGVLLKSVAVSESPTSMVVYEPNAAKAE